MSTLSSMVSMWVTRGIGARIFRAKKVGHRLRKSAESTYSTRVAAENVFLSGASRRTTSQNALPPALRKVH